MKQRVSKRKLRDDALAASYTSSYSMKRVLDDNAHGHRERILTTQSSCLLDFSI